MHTFAGIDLGHESVPDATTLLHFRHLLERAKLTAAIFAEVSTYLGEQHLLMREGTIIDATLIAAPSSTKNAARQRDPAMHQTRKGNQWYFGMKAHIGADAESGLVHSLSTTAANISDIEQTHRLLHGREKEVYLDAGYTGVEKREEIVRLPQDTRWEVAKKRGVIKKLEKGEEKEAIKSQERAKAQVRAKVEPPFHVLKNLFHHRKTRYRGLEKNTSQLEVIFALVNLFLARKSLAPAQS